MGVGGDDHGGGAHCHRCGGRGKTESGEGERSGGDGDGQQVVGGRPHQVLNHLGVGRYGQIDDAGNTAWVAGDQHHTRGFNGNICASADGDTDIGSSEGRCVIDAVTDHGNGQAPSLKLGYFGILIFGEYLGKHLVDAKLCGYGVGDLLSIAGDHDHLFASLMEGIDRDAGFGANLIGQRERTDNCSVAEDVENGTTCTAPLFERVHQLVGFAGIEMGKQGWPANGDLMTVDGALDPATGERSKF